MQATDLIWLFLLQIYYLDKKIKCRISQIIFYTFLPAMQDAHSCFPRNQVMFLETWKSLHITIIQCTKNLRRQIWIVIRGTKSFRYKYFKKFADPPSATLCSKTVQTISLGWRRSHSLRELRRLPEKNDLISIKRWARIWKKSIVCDLISGVLKKQLK